MNWPLLSCVFVLVTLLRLSSASDIYRTYDSMYLPRFDFQFTRAPPTPTFADLDTFRRGRHPNRVALLNAFHFALSAEGKCLTVVDPAVFDEELAEIEDIDEFLYSTEDENLCNDVIIPFEHEDEWSLAWVNGTIVHFLTDKHVDNKPIGVKVKNVAQLLFPEEEITTSQPSQCAVGRPLKEENEAGFVLQQAVILAAGITSPSDVCQAKDIPMWYLKTLTSMTRRECLTRLNTKPRGFEDIAAHTKRGYEKRTGEGGLFGDLAAQFSKTKNFLLNDEPEARDFDDVERVLMIKLKGGLETKSFINGQWGPEKFFRNSYIGTLLNNCGDLTNYRCMFWGPLEKTSKTHSQGFMVEPLNTSADDDRAPTWFCVHTWRDFDVECISEKGSVIKCLESLNTKNQEAFACFKMSALNAFLAQEYINANIMKFAEDYRGSSEHFAGGYVALDNALIPRFTSDTGLYIVLQRRSQVSHRLLYMHLQQSNILFKQMALWKKQMFMVRSGVYDNLNIYREVMVMGVDASLHPILAEVKGRGWVDNSNLAFNIPKDKTDGPFYVCFGDVTGEIELIIHAGGIYCWEDEALNRDLRCSSVPRRMYKEDDSNKDKVSLAESHEIPYQEWYSDCSYSSQWEISGKIEGIFKYSKMEGQKQFELNRKDGPRKAPYRRGEL